MHINVIKELNAKVEELEENLSIMCNQYEEAGGTLILFDEKLKRSNRQLQELMDENMELAEAREKLEKDVESFSHQVEERVRYYKSIMDERQREHDELKEKYESLIEQIPGIDVDSEESEIKRLMDALKERDGVIKELQAKLQLVSTELMDSTEVLNKIGREREESLQVRLTVTFLQHVAFSLVSH